MVRQWALDALVLLFFFFGANVRVFVIFQRYEKLVKPICIYETFTLTFYFFGTRIYPAYNKQGKRNHIAYSV
jgi:hypothetical protein